MRNSADPTGRTAGQYARATVTRLRMRTLVTLGVLAVATAPARPDVRAARLALPRLGDRAADEHVRDLPLRAAAAGAPATAARPARSRWGACWTSLLRRRLAGDPRRDAGPRQRRPHPDRPGRGVHGRDQEPPGTGAGGAGARCARSSQAQAQRRAIERVTGVSVEPLIVFSRAWVDRPLARRKGVRVVPARMLIGYLSRQAATLSGEEIEKARAVVEALHWATISARASQPARSPSPDRRGAGAAAGGLGRERVGRGSV